MKPKQTLILGLIVALLLGGIIVYEKVYQPRQRAERASSLVAFPDFDPAQVSAIEFHKGDYAARLAKQGEKWVVAGEADYPADPDGVTQMLDTIKTLRFSDLASTKAKTHELFEVDEAKGLKVTLQDAAGKTLAEFFVGKRGEQYGSTYFRKSGEDATYLAAKNLASVFDRSSDSWKDKAVARFEATEARKLEIRAETGALLLEKNIEQDAWELVEGEAKTRADASTVDGILRGLANLRAVEFAKVDLKETGLENPSRGLSVRLATGAELAFQVGMLDGTGNRYYLKRADQPEVFVVAKYSVDNLFKTKDELLPKPGAPSPEASPIPLPPPPLEQKP